MTYEVKGFFYNYSIYCILVFAFLLRCYGIWYGLPYLYSPDPNSVDEQCIMTPVMNMLFTGDINPHWAGFPSHIIMYFLAILLGLINIFLYGYLRLIGLVHGIPHFFIFLKTQIVSYTAFAYFVGRLVMAILGTITIYFVYAIGKKLFNTAIGILASLCLAIAPLHVLHSKVIRPDITTTLMILIALYCLYIFDENKKNKDILIYCYLSAGFAIATKYTSILIIVPVLIYCFMMDIKEKNVLTLSYIIDFLKLKTNSSRALFYIFFAFFITSSFVFLDFRQTLINFLIETRKEHIGQERLGGLLNHIWYFKGVLINGIGGLFFTVFACMGLMLIAARRSYKHYLLLLFPTLYYIVMVGFGNLRFYRWLIPILPFEAMLFGVGLYTLYRYLINFNFLKPHKNTIVLLCTIVMIGSSLPAIVHDIHEGVLLTRKDTRTIAKEWIEDNVPENARIAVEDNTPQLFILSKKRY